MNRARRATATVLSAASLAEAWPAPADLRPFGARLLERAKAQITLPIADGITGLSLAVAAAPASHSPSTASCCSTPIAPTGWMRSRAGHGPSCSPRASIFRIDPPDRSWRSVSAQPSVALCPPWAEGPNGRAPPLRTFGCVLPHQQGCQMRVGLVECHRCQIRAFFQRQQATVSRRHRAPRPNCETGQATRRLKSRGNVGSLPRDHGPAPLVA
jgi:hypothetical protein